MACCDSCYQCGSLAAGLCRACGAHTCATCATSHVCAMQCSPDDFEDSPRGDVIQRCFGSRRMTWGRLREMWSTDGDAPFARNMWVRMRACQGLGECIIDDGWNPQRFGTNVTHFGQLAIILGWEYPMGVCAFNLDKSRAVACTPAGQSTACRLESALSYIRFAGALGIAVRGQDKDNVAVAIVDVLWQPGQTHSAPRRGELAVRRALLSYV